MKAEKSLVGFFDERLTKLNVRDDTRAYVVGVLNDMRMAKNHDMSKQSITLAYFEAIQTGSLVGFQKIGDWVLFSQVMVPESIKERSLTLEFGRKSYGQCWRILQGQWVLYDELAIRLDEIALDARKLLMVDVRL